MSTALTAELNGLPLMAHIMGMAARRRGDAAVENPFTDEPDASSAWLDGWMRESGRPLPGGAALH